MTVEVDVAGRARKGRASEDEQKQDDGSGEQECSVVDESFVQSGPRALHLVPRLNGAVVQSGFGWWPVIPHGPKYGWAVDTNCQGTVNLLFAFCVLRALASCVG